MNYTNYLQSDYWKGRRKEFRDKTWNRCYICRAKGKLETHHKRYSKDGQSILFKERHVDLRLLCRKCHQGIHDLKLEKQLAGNLLKRREIRDLIKSYWEG